MNMEEKYDIYTIAPMSHRHIPHVAALDLICFSMPWSAQAFANEMGNNLACYHVLLDGDKVIGYYGMWRVLDEGYITNIAIHPDYRRRGLGSRLLAHMTALAATAGVRILTLEVRVSNAAAQGLYEKYGFKPAGVRHGYYSDNREDALIMTKEM